MSYFAKAVAGTSPSVRPAVRTRSPLAEVDQRLHIDAVADRFDVPVLGAGSAEPPPSSELDPMPAFEDPFDRSRMAAAPPVAPSTETGSRQHANPSRSQTEGRDDGMSGSRDALDPPHRARPREPRPAARVEPAPTEDRDPLSPGPFRPQPSVEAPRTTVGREPHPSVGTMPLPEAESRVRPRVETLRGVAPDHPRSPVAEPPTPNAEPMADMLNKLSSWFARPPVDAKPAEPMPPEVVSSSQAATTRPGHRAEAMVVQASPRLEIGNIEVEVLPMQQQRRPSAPARSAASGPSSSTRAFGWRQR